MLLKALNFMRGSVTISVGGAYIERFLNICAANDIAFWNVKRISCDLIYSDVRIKSFFKLCKYARRAMCRVHILKKNGFPFFIRRFKKRYALAAGLAVCAAAMFILSGYVWTVEINGCDRISSVQLMQSLNRNGFKIGMKTSAVDVDAIRNGVMSEQKEILWMTVNTIGSHAQIFIKEREQAPVMTDGKSAADIIAKRDGIITNVSVKNGISGVCVGQTVIKGELLVSGIYQSELTGVKQMHSSADIYARTWRSFRRVMPHPDCRLEKTGRKKTGCALVLGAKRINFYDSGAQPFEHCIKEERTKRLYLGKKLRLPICFVTRSVYECEACPAQPYYKDAEKILYNSTQSDLKAATDGQIIDKSFDITLENGVYTGIIRAECVENIAEERIILQSEPKQVNAGK